MSELAKLLKKNVPNTMQQFLPNETIVLQGEDSSKIFVGNEGWIKVSVYSFEGRDSIVAFCGPGIIIGLPTLFQRISFPVSALALSKAAVSVFQKSEVERFLLEHPDYMAEVIAILGQEVLHIKDVAIAAGSDETIEKIFNLLVHLAMTYGSKHELGWKVPFKLTQQHISDMTGLSRVSISACLKTLGEQGKIQIKNKEYTVLKKS